MKSLAQQRRKFALVPLAIALLGLCYCYKKSNSDAQITVSEIKIQPLTTPALEKQPAKKLTDEELLDLIQRKAFEFFWNEADKETGLIKDRAKNFGTDDYTVASIASTGFGLAGLAVGESRGWITHEQAYERALMTLRFFRDKMEHNHGFYYHFVDLKTGERMWESEISSIDTALFLAGALSIGSYFQNTEVQTIANELYRRVDFQWMLTDGGALPDELLLSHGWKPETGFLPYRWDSYNELMILYQLAIGSPTHPIPASSWEAWARPMGTYAGYTTFAIGPLFTHQYSHIFIDFQNKRDNLGYDYWSSSVNATKANRQFCIDKKGEYKTYSENVWGLTACDGPDGYRAYGAPPGHIDQDGTVSPGAPAASIVFTPELSISALKHIYQTSGNQIWGRYGFSNAFNLDRDWYDKDVIGIDLGPILLMIENYRSGLIWEHFNKLPSIANAMKKVGFTSYIPGELSKEFKEKLLSRRLITYTPTNFDPTKGILPPKESIKEDLSVLREAGFQGIVTYGNNDNIVETAQELGIDMIYGVWDPLNSEELRLAREAGQNPTVLGFVIGNEGLNDRYGYHDLKLAIEDVMTATSKPATFTEESHDYQEAPHLMELGSWIFPNCHAYWSGITEATEAVLWTVEQYQALTAAAPNNRVVCFKEVGLPTDGDPNVNEEKQAAYYKLLDKTSVAYIYFEAFDQEWKVHEPVEPHWGLFRSDRTTKLVVKHLPSQ